MTEMEKLFNEWRELLSSKSDHFVEDGIIYPEKWAVVNTKVLFILKETNNYKGDIAELIRNAVLTRPKSKLWNRPTFHNIGRWAYGLINMSGDIVEYKDAHKNRKYSLLSCAFINIKKTTGGKVATKAVEENAKEYSSLLKSQIDIINPDIIVFGGTYKIIKDHVLPELEKKSFRVHMYKKFVCINANHPACTKKRKEVYDQVVVNYSKYLSENENAIQSEWPLAQSR